MAIINYVQCRFIEGDLEMKSQKRRALDKIYLRSPIKVECLYCVRERDDVIYRIGIFSNVLMGYVVIKILFIAFAGHSAIVMVDARIL